MRLGDEVVFEAASDLDGRLVILDINANGEVTVIFPNQLVAATDIGRIATGGTVAVPGPDDPGFTACQAVEPTGKGQLLALVVPEDFDIERHAAGSSLLSKGFAPVDNPPSYIIRLIRQIEQALLNAAEAGRSAEQELARWGYAVTGYEITRQ